MYESLWRFLMRLPRRPRDIAVDSHGNPSFEIGQGHGYLAKNSRKIIYVIN